MIYNNKNILISCKQLVRENYLNGETVEYFESQSENDLKNKISGKINCKLGSGNKF